MTVATISQVLVCPPDEALLARLRGRTVVIRSEGWETIPGVAQLAAAVGVTLHCLRVEARVPLASIPFEEQWAAAPLALHLPGLGPRRDLFARASLLRKLNMRVFLPSSSAESCTSLRILASLGIPSALVLEDGEVDWEMAADLATYALLGLVPHAPIGPFDLLAERYDPTARTDYAALYFDDPATYLHVDAEGRIALTSADLAAGALLPLTIDELGELGQCAPYQEGLERWRRVFLEVGQALEGCACCPGWRVCLAKFPAEAAGAAGCRAFFVELLEVLDKRRVAQARERQLWLP